MHQQEPGVRRGRGWLAGLLAAILAAAATTARATAGAIASPPPPRWIHVAAGWDFTCGIREGNTLWCWGGNGSTSGEPGHGPGADTSLPQQITRPTAGAAGSSHTCALRIHALWCGGDDTAGDVGIGHTSQQNLPRRVAVPARTGCSLVAAGGARTCAIRTGHAHWCWGWNRYGQLGPGGTTTCQFRPRQVTA